MTNPGEIPRTRSSLDLASMVRCLGSPVGSGIGSTPTPSAQAGYGDGAGPRSDGFRSSMKVKARNALSKMFSSPSSARAGSSSSTSGQGSVHSGMPRKGSARHLGSLSSSNLASSFASGAPSSRIDVSTSLVSTTSTDAGRLSFSNQAGRTLPSRSSSHRTLAGSARDVPPLPENEPAWAPPLSSAMVTRSGPGPQLLKSISPERRATEPHSQLSPLEIEARSPSARHPLPDFHASTSPRRRSMSVSDAVGGEGSGRSWEYDVEGLLDGIIGSRSPVLTRKPGDRNAVSTSSSPRHPGQSVFQQQLIPGVEGTLTTTITAGKGKAARSIVGSTQRVLQPLPLSTPVVNVPLGPYRPSVSSVRSYIDLDTRRPSVASVTSERITPHLNDNRSDSPRSAASQSTQSLADGLTLSNFTSSYTAEAPSGTHLVSTIGSLPSIPTSPSGPLSGLVDSSYVIAAGTTVHPGSSRVAQAAADSNIDLSEDLDDGSPAMVDRSSPRFQGKTIRLVPASPSPQLPPLPNSSPMPTPSRFLLRRTASDDQPSVPSVPNWSTTTSRPLIDQLDNAGLGISAAPPSKSVALGEEIDLRTIEEEAADIVKRILAEDVTLKWVAENRVAEFLGGRSVSPEGPLIALF